MELEDILKYIFIALFFLPGLFAKKKKKQDSSQPNPYENRHELADPFEDFRTFNTEDTVADSAYEEAYNPAPAQNTNLDTVQAEEGTSVFSQKQIEAALASMANYEHEHNEIEKTAIKSADADIASEADHALADFDIQQAVIYSEILTPKYSC